MSADRMLELHAGFTKHKFLEVWVLASHPFFRDGPRARQTKLGLSMDAGWSEEQEEFLPMVWLSNGLNANMTSHQLQPYV